MWLYVEINHQISSSKLQEDLQLLYPDSPSDGIQRDIPLKQAQSHSAAAAWWRCG